MAAGAAARAELETTLRDVIEHRHALGELGGMVHLRQRIEDARADVHAFGGVRQITGDDVIGREMRVLVEEVMLG